jgi:hypothetical protein
MTLRLEWFCQIIDRKDLASFNVKAVMLKGLISAHNLLRTKKAVKWLFVRGMDQ